MSEDKRLLKGLQRGDKAALQQIYLKYKDDLITIARSLVFDINTAEDCLHDVFVMLASSNKTIRSNVKGYLLSCTVNRARDYLRKKENLPSSQLNTELQHSPQPSPLTTLAEDDEMKALLKSLYNAAKTRHDFLSASRGDTGSED